MPTSAALKLNNDMNFALWLKVDLKNIQITLTMTQNHKTISVQTIKAIDSNIVKNQSKRS